MEAKGRRRRKSQHRQPYSIWFSQHQLCLCAFTPTKPRYTRFAHNHPNAKAPATCLSWTSCRPSPSKLHEGIKLQNWGGAILIIREKRGPSRQEWVPSRKMKIRGVCLLGRLRTFPVVKRCSGSSAFLADPVPGNVRLAGQVRRAAAPPRTEVSRR